MTQADLAQALAAELGRPEPYTKQFVSLIEKGERAVDKRSMLIALARALGVALTDLTGQPYPATDRTDVLGFQVAHSVRAALDDADDPTFPRPHEQLRHAADRAMVARMACDLPAIGAHLPDLLTDTRTLYFGQGDERAGQLLVRAAVTGSLALKPAGFIDLAVRLAELAEQVAEQLGDPVCIAAAKFARAQCSLASGARRRSYEIVTGAMAVLDGPVSSSPARMHDTFAWLAMLNLHAALTAASLHREDDAQAHLTQAGELTRRVQGDPWWMEATEANCRLWAVGVALENGDAGRAPELARRVNVTELHTPQRQARLYLDTARGLHAVGRHDDAIRALLVADDHAPGDLRQRATAVETVGDMVRAAPARGGSAALTELARRVGVSMVNPPEAA
jgi:transcriptional regulator with XRE-family HTH domain